MKNTSKMFEGFVGVGLVLLLVFALAAQATAQNWTELLPTGGPPSVRTFHSAVHNPTTNRMIVFGGHSSNGFGGPGSNLNDVWILENADGLGGTPKWTQLSPTGGPPDGGPGHSAVYNPTANRMIVFGGNPGFGYGCCRLNDVWVLANADGTEPSTPNWTQLSPTGGTIPELWLHSAVYDPANNWMVVFGGVLSGTINSNEVWVLTNADGLGGTPNWTQLNPTYPLGGTIPARESHTTVYDPATNRMTVFGGTLTAPPGGFVNDVWVLEDASGLDATGNPVTPNWIQLSPTGGPPTTTRGPGVYDPATNRMIVCGGKLATGYDSNEVWVLENANGLGGTPNWTQLSPTGGPISTRDAHSAVLNVGTNTMTVFAGRTNTITPLPPAFNDVWVLTDANGIVEEDNTRPGGNVRVDLGKGGIVTFDQVDTGGNTTLETFTSGPEPENFYLPLAETTYYYITTTARFTGEIHIEISYDDTGLTEEEEDALRLYHYEDPNWVDVTDPSGPPGPRNPNTGADKITGTVTTLSYFVVGIPTAQSVVDKAFLSPKKLNLNRKAQHSFKIHIQPSEAMDVSVGNLAEVFVDVDGDEVFGLDELYPAFVSSTDVDGEALDIAIKVYCEDLVNNDPGVAIYSINDIDIVHADELGGGLIEDLALDTFLPPRKGHGKAGAPGQNK